MRNLTSLYLIHMEYDRHKEEDLLLDEYEKQLYTVST